MPFYVLGFFPQLVTGCPYLVAVHYGLDSVDGPVRNSVFSPVQGEFGYGAVLTPARGIDALSDMLRPNVHEGSSRF